MDIYFESCIPDGIETLELPNPELVNFWNLAEKRIYYINQDIDNSILDFQQDLVRINFEDKNIPIEERKPIYFLINSNGGLLSETMSLAITMQMSKTPVYTINLGAAYSGGSVLLLAGQKRYALPYSKAMIHSGSGELGGTHEQVQAQSKKYEREIADMMSFILKRTQLSKKEYNKRKTQDWYLIGDEQVKYGVVDEMVDNLFDLLGA